MEQRIGDDKSYAVVSSKGGTVRQFVWQGSEIIYPERAVVGGKSRGGIPICFPVFSHPPENFFSIPHHGWLRDQELESILTAKKQIIFAGRNEPSKVYPWEIEYEVDVFIDEEGLRINFATRRLSDNKSDGAPVNIGFHPYFSNLGKHLAIIGLNGIPRTFGEFKKKSVERAFDEPVYVDAGEWLMKMSFGGEFNRESSCIVLWSDNAKSYFCVEPVLTYPHLFASSHGGYFLGQNQMLTVSFTILPIAKFSK